MSRGTKVWLIIATLFVIVGMLIFGGVMVAFQWDFTKLSTVKYETNETEVTEKYDNISVITMVCSETCSHLFNIIFHLIHSFNSIRLLVNRFIINRLTILLYNNIVYCQVSKKAPFVNIL